MSNRPQRVFGADPRPPPSCQRPTGYWGFYSHWSRKSHPTRKASGKRESLPSPIQASRARSGWPGCGGHVGRCRKGAWGGRSCSHISLPTTRVSTQLPSTGTGTEPTSEHVHANLPAAARGQAQGEEGPSEPQSWSFPPSASTLGARKAVRYPTSRRAADSVTSGEVSRPQGTIQSPCLRFCWRLWSQMRK